MPKLTANSTEPPSRVELAERHLADLRNRAAEIDRRGAGLLADLQALPDRIATASLDAIENEAKRPGLTALEGSGAYRAYCTSDP